MRKGERERESVRVREREIESMLSTVAMAESTVRGAEREGDKCSDSSRNTITTVGGR